MDPLIMKKLLEDDDDDETMHSGADLEAFQDALSKDTEGFVSASDSAVLAQGKNITCSQSLPQLSTASHDENTAAQIQDEQKIAQHGELNSDEIELKQQGSVPENMQQKNDASQKLNHFSLPKKKPHDDLQQGQAEQKLLQISETTGMTIAGKNPGSTQELGITPNLKSESQYLKLQKMSSEQSMITEQPRNPLNGNKQVPFNQVIPLLESQLAAGRASQLRTLYRRYKRNEMHVNSFVRNLKSIAGDEMIKMAVLKVEVPSPKHWLPPQASVQQQTPRMLSSSVDATQLNDPCSLEVHLRGANSPTDPSHIPPSSVQVQTDSRHPVENSAVKFPETESHSDSHGMQVSQMPSSCAVASDQERECSSVHRQVLNKPQQQQLHNSQSSLSMHGNAGGTCLPYSGTKVNTCALPVKQQPPDAQPRQSQQHQTMGSAQSGGEAHGTNIMNMFKMKSQNSMNDPSRLQGGSRSHFNNSATLEQNPVPCKSSNKEQSSDPLSSMAYVKKGSFDQTSTQQHNPSLPDSQGLPSVSAALLEQGNASSGIPMDEVLETSSRMGASTSVSIAPSSSTSTLPPISVSPSITMQVNPSVLLGPQITSGTSPSGTRKTTLPKKRSTSQKKPLEALGSSLPQSSKKQKVSGAFLDIEELNDVTSVTGVNLEEEEELLFSGSKKHSQASEASRKFVQEEEERLILHKAPLQKKIGEIMLKCGLKSVRNDVERCLSLCVEERMRGLIYNSIRLSKQRVDAEKSRHHTITTSDVRQQIIDHNWKAREDREKKPAEAEKLWKIREEKDEGHPKSFQTNKMDDHKLRTAAANVAALAAVGGDDMFSKWKLMAQARKQRDGEIDAASGSQPVQDVNRTPTSTAGRIMKESQEAEKTCVAAAGTLRKARSNQVTMTQTRMARRISVKDMIAALEREPQMSKSTLLYRLHERIHSDTAIA